MTGATGGVGPAVVETFKELGATVFATTRGDASESEGVVDVQVDLTREDEALALADRVRAESGRCDALACCAGGFEAGEPVAEAESRGLAPAARSQRDHGFLRPGLPAADDRGAAGVRSCSSAPIGGRAVHGGVAYTVSKAAVIAVADGARRRGAATRA